MDYINLIEISNSTYYAAGFYPVPYDNICSDDNQAVYGIVKNNSQILKGKQYGTTGGIREGAQNNSSMVDRQGKYIYNTCISDLTDPIVMGINYTPTSILTAKIDTSGNLVWQKYFNTPNYYYEPLAVAATSDSGVVVSGMRYNTLMPAFIDAFEGFILKYDKNGNQVMANLKELYQPFADVILFPNPATNKSYLKFNNIDELGIAEITIVNNIGQLVNHYKTPLVTGHNSIEIDTKLLSNGLYYIELSTQTGSVTQKFSVIK
jgi:hypothetical protein